MNSGKARAGTAKERSVFVGNIPYDVTEEMLKEIFSGAGTVVNFRLVTDRETGKPKGYGFCEYADGATALSAMRNLNGYEVNGRNLRVDFADGGDKSNSNNGGNNNNNNNNSYNNNNNNNNSGYSNDKHHHPTSVSGEAIIQAIEGAISRFGPLKLYDMLVDLKEHARQRPDHTKSMLMANPALTHAIVQCFKTLNIPIPSSTEMPPALLSAPPPPHLHGPPHMGGRPLGPPPPMQRSSLAGPPPGVGGGILGMAPPGPPPPGSMGPPPPLVAVLVAPGKPGGTRWSARPGPLAGMMAPPQAQVGPGMAGPPPMQQQQQQPMYQGGGPPPSLMGMAPPSSSAAQAQGQQQQQQQMSRDPRQRARDPRLAKRSLGGPEPVGGGMDMKRQRPDEGYQQHQHQQQAPASQGNHGTYDAIAELARDMTPQKLNMLPPNERQILVMYMQQHGIPFSS